MSARDDADELRPEYAFGPEDYRRADRGRFAAGARGNYQVAEPYRREGPMDCTAVVQQRGEWWVAGSRSCRG